MIALLASCRDEQVEPLERPVPAPILVGLLVGPHASAGVDPTATIETIVAASTAGIIARAESGMVHLNPGRCVVGQRSRTLVMNVAISDENSAQRPSGPCSVK